ncbi:unnamed protein product [Symbiodinium sp. CCMP2592]|nr:unnamed protein product [Symbiodinium sp. CCMP2592]
MYPPSGIPQWPPQRATSPFAAAPAGNVAANLSDELATKVAEVTILRSRLQASERENTRLENELAFAKDSGPAKQSQQRQELERVHGELQYARQDLISSEDERKRLRLTLQKMQQEMEELKARAPVAEPAAKDQIQHAEPAPAPAPQTQPGLEPLHGQQESMKRSIREHRSCDEPMNEDMSKQYVGILVGLAERFGSSERQRLALQAAVTSFPQAPQSVHEASCAAAALLRGGLEDLKWASLSAGATFLKHWFGLFPLHLPEIAESIVKGKKETNSLFSAMAAVLHSAVLDSTNSEEEEALLREGCAREFLAALLEAASKLPCTLFAVLSPVLEKPSLFALICEDPAPDSLHLPSLRLLEVLMASPSLFTLAHQAETDENVLLAVANVLMIPSVKTAESAEDSVEHQECRVASLELLLRCLATAPSPDFILQLRGAAQGEEVDEVDTVLQRVVLLCHHELLCLRLGARAPAPQRKRAAELSLFIISGWLWHAFGPALSSQEQTGELSLKLCNQLGRTRILIESIVEMVQVLSSQTCFKAFLSSASALRMLLPFTDGDRQSFGEISRYWPNAPRPQPNDLLDPARPPQVPAGPATPARAKARALEPRGAQEAEETLHVSDEEQEVLARFARSEELKVLRRQLRQDMKALENFLEEMQTKDPLLMRVIATNKQAFMKMALSGLAEEARAETKLEKEEASQPETSESRAVVKQKEAKKQLRTQRALLPTTSSSHTLALLHSPYSCAVCKATSATHELFLCSSCQSVRFCSRECQRKFWPRHQTVCRFIASVRGGLLKQVSGQRWMQDALPQVVDVWTRSRSQLPQPWELEQLVHLPRCRVCRTVPATLVCPVSRYAGYCSEACIQEDGEHQSSWMCSQVRSTAVAAYFMHKAGGCCSFTTRCSAEELPASIFEGGWQEFVKCTELQSADGQPFSELGTTAQQTIIDALSFPMIAIEGCRLAGQSWESLRHLKVHVLGAYGSTLADLYKYEEWLRRGWNLKSMEIHFIGPEVQIPSSDSDVVTASVKLDLCDSLTAQDRTATCFFHRCSIMEFIEEEVVSGASPPTFRLAYSPSLHRLPLGDPSDQWGKALRRLADLDDTLLVVSEKNPGEIAADRDRLRECGFRALVKPRMSNFPSPLALYDDMSTPEENPLGLNIWNMSMAVFKACKPGDPDTDAGEDDSDSEAEEESADSDEDQKESKDALRKLTEQAEAPSIDDFSVGDRVLVRKFMKGTVTGLRCNGFPHGVQVQHPDGSRKHYLPEELIKINASAAVPAPQQNGQLDLEDARYDLCLDKAGPWTCDGKSMEDMPHTDSANPESFVVSLSVRCDGGQGFRSPLTSRDTTPPCSAQWVLWIPLVPWANVLRCSVLQQMEAAHRMCEMSKGFW